MQHVFSLVDRHEFNGVEGSNKQILCHVRVLVEEERTKEQAFDLAQGDNDQYIIDRIIAYKGDPYLRTSMEFEVAFMDGTTVWVNYSQDIFQTVHFEDFAERLRGATSWSTMSSKQRSRFAA